MVTQAAVADHLDLNPRKVRELVAMGRLPKGGSLDECRIAYIRMLRQTAAGHVSQDGEFDLTAERARLAKEQADGQSMKNAQLRGELLSADDVERAWSDVLREVRSAMLSIPSRIGARLGHLTAAEIAEIDREVRETLKGAAGAND